MINQRILTDYLQAACEIHGKSFSQNLVNGWAACTKSVSTEQFENVFWECASDRFPKPSQLLQAVAGIKPADDWEVIMMVATGRCEVGQISGFAAASLRQIGGAGAIASADEVGTRSLHKRWLEGLTTGGSGLPAAQEEISLSPRSHNSNVVDLYRPDSLGEHRADALIELLRNGTIKPVLAKRLAIAGDARLGKASGGLPAAQRDRVLAAIGELASEGLPSDALG